MNKIEVGKKYRVTRSARENGNVIEIYKMTKDSAYYETLVGVNVSQSFFGLNSDFCKGLIPYDEDENTKFKVGDRVKAIRSVDGSTYIKGKIGTVKHFKKTARETWYGVEFDEYIHGHDLHGKCEYGRGWKCNESSLEPVHDNNKIVITTDGKTTTAKLYDNKKLVKSAKADCHPDDEFDFEKGAGIAISRLLEWDFVPAENTIEEEHFYNGKVVCVSNKHVEKLYTVGKIYQYKNGITITDNGYETIPPVHDIDELNSGYSKWLEIVE